MTERLGGQHDRRKCQESLNGLKSPTPLEQKNEESVIEGKRVTVYAKEITKDLAQVLKNMKAISIAMRTRNYAGIPQRIEVGGTMCNSITTATKDFLVLIIL